jgi:hypothetical protein
MLTVWVNIIFKFESLLLNNNILKLAYYASNFTLFIYLSILILFQKLLNNNKISKINNF